MSDDRRLAVALIGEKSVSGVEIDNVGLTVRASDYGSFTRAVGLPQGVDEDEIKASYWDGVLEVRVPKPAVVSGICVALPV